MTNRIHRINDSNMRMRVTISDVSEALGVTKSTVSRALNDYSDISENTRLRVRRMAEKMGYRPLSHAQAIRTGRSKSLGLVIQMSDHDAHRPFLAEFLAGLSQGASAEGWTLAIATADSPAATIESITSMIRDRKADGFILARTLVNDPRVELLREMQFPFVMFGRSGNLDSCAFHDVLGEDAMRDAVRHLAELGHTRIGFINGGMHFNYGPLRLSGYLAGMAECGLDVDPDHILQDAMTPQAGEAASRNILKTGTPPTALVCGVDMAAIGVYRTAAAFGLTVGRDLSVIGYDGIFEGTHVTPPLTTFAVNHVASGRKLSTMLIRRVMGKSPENLRDLVPAIFKDRGSAGPPHYTSAQLARTIAQKD